MKQSLQIISKQTSWQLVGKFVSSLSTFIILSLIARNYGEEGTGIFTLALGYLAIFYLLSDFGLNAHILKEIQNDPLRLKLEFQKLLGVRIIWSAVLVIFALITLPLWPFATLEFNQAVVIGSLAILGSGIYSTSNLVFQSKLRYDLSVVASSFGILAGLGFSVFLINLQTSLPYLLLAHLFGWFLNAFLGIWLLHKYYHFFSPIFDKGYALKLFKSSWPIAATLALNVIYFKADSFMISYFKSPSEVGIYNIAYSIFQTALVLPTLIMNAYYPLMLKSLNGIKLMAGGLLGLGILGTVFTFALSPFLIVLITGGAGFRGAIPTLQILSFGFPAFFLSSLLMWYMVSKNQYKRLLWVYGIGLLINISLNLILIPKYSFYGASFTTVISEYLILLIQLVLIWQKK